MRGRGTGRGRTGRCEKEALEAIGGVEAQGKGRRGQVRVALVDVMGGGGAHWEAEGQDRVAWLAGGAWWRPGGSFVVVYSLKGNGERRRCWGTPACD